MKYSTAIHVHRLQHHHTIAIETSLQLQYPDIKFLSALGTLASNATTQHPTNGSSDPAISIRFGAVQDKDVEMQDVDADALGASKRKSRTSIDQKKSYIEPESSDDDDEPLVRRPLGPKYPLLFWIATSISLLVSATDHFDRANAGGPL